MVMKINEGNYLGNTWACDGPGCERTGKIEIDVSGVWFVLCQLPHDEEGPTALPER